MPFLYPRRRILGRSLSWLASVLNFWSALANISTLGMGRETLKHGWTKVSWKPRADQGRRTQNSSLLREKLWCMLKCYHLRLKSQLALHTVCGRWVPVNLAFLLPELCLGDETSTVGDSGDGYKAGGREWHVQERRELHERVRTKITSLWQEQGFHYIKTIPVYWVSICYCRTVWFFVATSM